MHAMNTQIKSGFFPLFFNNHFHFFLSLFHHLFNPSGMDSTVANQILQGDPGDFPAVHVKAGDRNGLRGVIDDNIDARGGLEGADITAFPADDAAFHLVARQRNDRYRRAGRMIRGAALNSAGDNLARLFIRGLPDLLLCGPNTHGLLVNNLRIPTPQKKALGILLAHRGYFLQALFFLLNQLIELLFLLLSRFFILLHFGQPAADILFLALQEVYPLIEIFLLLLNPLLGGQYLFAALLCLGLKVLMQFNHQVFSLQLKLFLAAFRLSLGGFNQASGLMPGLFEPSTSKKPPYEITGEKRTDEEKK